MKLLGPINSGAAVGIAGAASSSAESKIRVTGRLAAIYVRYNDSPPITTDITISTKGVGGAPPTYNLLSIANANTSGWFYPHAPKHDVNGTVIAGQYTFLVVYDYVTVSIAQADPGDSVDIWLMVCDYDYRD